ncbi:hypothetical protein AVV13_gp48 [Streptomyces phage SF1]|uniref:Uncharacterized protein n=2 Tax=Caudoviricetes TaxID=2731619 RepID=A0A0K1Y5A8_9CAUD|nr:hypothetical protein [Streptomyces sp. SPB78]YP_009199296.1 hypothetical protein AVV13_gp48 [Streptomyces phage SF1]YP_009213155.1 hypothetical protein AVV12_gp28 [Streptomyces phage SF3]AKY02197.1 hypothetical protein SF1_480 [Streptomyces phage SF1]ALF00159.1 hypothetical protein SF3_280 [Streptomyces phage SF3]EFL00566.1 predicted protein [Streptomyces sp. SPB78]
MTTQHAAPPRQFPRRSAQDRARRANLADAAAGLADTSAPTEADVDEPGGLTADPVRGDETRADR